MLPMRSQHTVCEHTRTAAERALSMSLMPQRHEQRCKALGPNLSIICTTDMLGTESFGYLAGAHRGLAGISQASHPLNGPSVSAAHPLPNVALAASARHGSLPNCHSRHRPGSCQSAHRLPMQYRFAPVPCRLWFQTRSTRALWPLCDVRRPMPNL